MAELDINSLFAEGLQRFAKEQLTTVFNPDRPDLEPTPAQLSVLKNTETISQFVVGGNRCLAEGTLIATSSGPVPIEKVKVGDTVYDENGNPVKVLKTFNNGPKPVVSLKFRSWTKAKCTLNHIWLTKNSSKAKQGTQQKRVENFVRDTQIRKVDIKATLGIINEPHAYAIGALLGDGCSLATQHQIYISSADYKIPEKVAAQLENTYKKIKGNNHNWSVGSDICNHYKEWCKFRKAHEKTCDLEIIKTWNRESLLNYIAGLLDTDGSVYLKDGKILTIRWEMQAKPVIESIQYALLALWQIESSIIVNDREKFVNGPTYTIGIYNSIDAKKALKELNSHLVTLHKKYKSEYEDLKSSRTSEGWSGVNVVDENEIVRTYDIHVDSLTNLYCLSNGFCCHNSGKSQLGARVATWWLTETHPYMKRPKEWGNGPLTIMVIGRVGEQIESELFVNKIKPYLTEGTYKIVRIGNILQRIEHQNGNRMIFFSHHNINEAREKVQAFTVHFIWLDEMADSASFIAELQTRIVTTRGRMLATFTPLIRSDEVRQLVDMATEPISSKTILSMLDNPIIANNPERLQEVLAQFENYSESERRTRLYGDWYYGDTAVYEFNNSRNVSYPTNYSYTWRHIASADPAMSGKTGLTVWTENPADGRWTCILARYLENILTPDELVDKIEELIKPFNIIRRVADPHEVWFINTAAKKKFHYVGVYKKNERKKELIKNFQTNLSNGGIQIHPECKLLIEEIISCQWSETVADKIVNATKYHLLDSAHYFVDNKPKWVPIIPQDAVVSFEADLRKRHKEAKKKRDKLKLKRTKRWR